MAKINLATLQSKSAGGNNGGDVERGSFKADALTVTITQPDGTVVLETVMEARAFSPNDKGKGGCGWYADVKAKDGATYKGLPISAGLRVSLSGLKISASDSVDLLGDEG